MTYVFAICNIKGGVGKTTSTANIGAALALKKYKVLLIDLDPQASLTLTFGLKKKGLENTIYEVLRGEGEIKPIPIKKNLDIIPSKIDLNGAEAEFSKVISRETILKRRLPEIVDRYDFLLIDCPPALNVLTLNAFAACQSILIPLQSEFLALDGMGELLNAMTLVKETMNPTLHVAGVFMTRYKDSLLLNKGIAKALHRDFQGRVFETRIRDNTALSVAPYKSMDIFASNPRSFGAEDYMSLTNEILKLIKN